MEPIVETWTAALLAVQRAIDAAGAANVLPARECAAFRARLVQERETLAARPPAQRG
jgi:hypothetical protein